MTDAEFAPACVRAALVAFGGESIDILVNNAGELKRVLNLKGNEEGGYQRRFSQPPPPFSSHLFSPSERKKNFSETGYTWDGMAHKLRPEQWDAMLAVHCTAPFRLIQAAAPYMRDAAKREKEASPDGRPRPRSIINVSSTSGTHGNAGQANYATAKAGVVGLTKTIAKEWGMFNVRCNALAFGFIATRLTGDKGAASITVKGKTVALGIPGGEAAADAAAEMMIPLGRVGTPEEAAGAMLMLCSPYAGFVSGQTLEVTGGAFI